MGWFTHVLLYTHAFVVCTLILLFLLPPYFLISDLNIFPSQNLFFWVKCILMLYQRAEVQLHANGHLPLVDQWTEWSLLESPHISYTCNSLILSLLSIESTGTWMQYCLHTIIFTYFKRVYNLTVFSESALTGILFLIDAVLKLFSNLKVYLLRSLFGVVF